MTNHIHMICLGNKLPLSDILRDFKTFTSKELVKLIRDNPKESRKEWMLKTFENAGSTNPLNKHFQVWQIFNSPTLLDINYLMDQKATYIHNNPVVAGFVSKPHEYYYSSANENGPIVTLDF